MARVGGQYTRKQNQDGSFGKRTLVSATEKPQVAGLRNKDGSRLDGAEETVEAKMTNAELKDHKSKGSKAATVEAKASKPTTTTS